MKRLALLAALALAPCWIPALCSADTLQRIYTATVTGDTGGLKGSCATKITHALAVNVDRVHVYRGEVSADGGAFTFQHLPIGKYDVVLVTSDRLVYEGLSLGAGRSDLPPGSMENLKKRVEAQDAFFNHTRIHRLGFGGTSCLLFVERTSDRQILKQSGELLGADVRRLEILELAQAGDDWQVSGTRHLYREEQPLGPIDFLADKFVPEFCGLRVVDGVKDLGRVTLPLR